MGEFVPAKRGMIAILSKQSSGYSLVAGCFSTLTITVGTVESVTRDGMAKRVKPADRDIVKTPRDWDSMLLLDPAVLTDPAAFLAECKIRQTPDPGTYRPFADMNDVRETARKWKKS